MKIGKTEKDFKTISEKFKDFCKEKEKILETIRNWNELIVRE